MSDVCQKIANWIAGSQSAVAFTGAGISTDSGIPDFRSPGGVWSRNQPVYYDDFLRRAEARLEYWRQKAESHVDMTAASPNITHRSLAQWERADRLRGVITQNIDGLHQLAGSQNVLELHGTARLVTCLDCQARYDAAPLVEEFNRNGAVPTCPECGSGLMKHATISFGQQLVPDVLHKASAWARDADLFLALGSSLVVEPAASLPRLAKEHGARLVILNRDPTPLDRIADCTLHDELGPAMRSIAQAVSSLLPI